MVVFFFFCTIFFDLRWRTWGLRCSWPAQGGSSRFVENIKKSGYGERGCTCFLYYFSFVCDGGHGVRAAHGLCKDDCRGLLKILEIKKKWAWRVFVFVVLFSFICDGGHALIRRIV